MTPLTREDRIRNGRKGGLIGGPKSPSRFKKGDARAKEAGSKGGQVSSKLGTSGRPAANVVACDWCDWEGPESRITAHLKTEHPKLYRKHVASEEE